MTWLDLLAHWALIEPDLHERYQIDLDAPGLLAGRSWRWLRVRIIGLLSVDSRLARALAPPPDPGTAGRPSGWR